MGVSVEEFLDPSSLSPRTYSFFERFGALGAGAAGSEWSALSGLSLIAAFGSSAYAWFAANSNSAQPIDQPTSRVAGSQDPKGRS